MELPTLALPPLDIGMASRALVAVVLAMETEVLSPGNMKSSLLLPATPFLVAENGVVMGVVNIAQSPLLVVLSMAKAVLPQLANSSDDGH